MCFLKHDKLLGSKQGNKIVTATYIYIYTSHVISETRHLADIAPLHPLSLRPPIQANVLLW